jgi:hypothetical protein
LPNSSPQVSFELLNFMELIGESMGIHIPDLYKRLRFLGDVDAIIADIADLIAQHGLDVTEVREALLYDMFGGRAKSSASSAGLIVDHPGLDRCILMAIRWIPDARAVHLRNDGLAVTAFSSSP